MSKLKFSTDSLNWTTATINTYDVSEWQLTNSNIGSTQVLLMDYGNGLWFAYENNKMVQSTNGINWSTLVSEPFSTNRNILSIIYSNNLWVMGGTYGSLRISTNGMLWTTVSSNLSTPIRTIEYGNGIWSAGASSGRIDISTNAINWSTVNNTAIAGTINTIKYANNLWVAGSANGEIAQSTNAVIWNIVTSNAGGNKVNSIAYGNGIWLAAISDTRGIRRSTNTVSWSTVNIGSSGLISIDYGNGRWVAGGYASFQIFTSTDTTSWTIVNSNFTSGNIHSIKYDNNSWIAAGSSGQLRNSTDGITWTTPTSISFHTSSTGVFTRISSVAYGNGIWIAGGYSGQIRTSTDKLVWNWTPLTFGNTTISAIRYINNIFFIKPLYSPDAARISTNGISWTTASFLLFDKNTIDYGQGKWLFASGTTLRSSTDLISWTSLNTGASTTSLAYGNNLWIAVSQTSTLRTSTDTVSWSPVSVSLTANKVLYGNNLWIISDTVGNTRNSTNGTTWINSSNINSNSNHASLNIYFNNNLWWMNATSATSSYNNTSISNDGINWTTIPIDLKVINSVTYGNNRWVIGGNSNDIYYTTNLGYKTISTFGNIKESENINGIWAANTSNNEILINIQGVSELGKFSFANTYSQTIKQISSYDNKFAFLEDNKIMESNDLKTFTTNYLSWTSVYIGSESSHRFYTVKYTNNLWMVGGSFPANNLMKSIDGIIWTSLNSNFSSSEILNGIRGIAYGNNVWLISSYGGAFRSSTDTVTWTTVNALNVESYSLDYGNGTFVSAGSRQRLIRSTDLISWTTLNFNFGNSNARVNYIKYDNNLWVFGTSRGQIYTSTDSSSWTARGSGGGAFGTNDEIGTIQYGQGKWIAGSIGTNAIAISTDAVTWISQTVIAARNITYGQGIWYLYNNSGNQIYSRTSTDAISWQTSNDFLSVGDAMYDIAYANGRWVAVGPNSNIIKTYIYRTSNDKFNKIIKTKDNKRVFVLTNKQIIYNKLNGDTNWKIKEIPINDNFINGAISLSNSSIDIENTAIFWDQINKPNTNVIYSIEYGNGLWAIGQNNRNLHVSTDLINWTSTATHVSNPNVNINTIKYDNGFWVMGSYYDIRTSIDGIIWSTVTSNFAGATINKIDYGNGLWIAGGNSSRLSISTNSINWTSINSNMAGQHIRGVAYGQGIWAIVGDAGFVRRSTNGITWTTVNSGFASTSIYDIAYGNGIWVIAGWAGLARSSTDLISWTSINSKLGSTIIYSVKNNNGLWFASTGSTNGVSRSTDSINWTLLSVSVGGQVETAYGNNTHVLGGSKLFYSKEIYNPDLYDIIGNNASYRSTDLMSWTTIASLSTPRINQTEINDITSTN